MQGLSKDTLRRLGEGETIRSICTACGIDRSEFLSLWRHTAAARVPPITGLRNAAVSRPVSIERGSCGIPRIYAESDADLLFGFGYAMAQDRLFQLDWLRRKGAGRLAEIVGSDGLSNDVLVRTVGLNRIARKHCEEFPEETRQ